MKRSIKKIRGLGFILWHSRHEFYHALLGLAWAWILRELWNEFNAKWIFLALLGSVLPDADHLFYLFTYGKKDFFSSTVKTMVKKREWRNLVVFIEHGHKHNTELTYHNVYFIGLLLVTTMVFVFLDLKSWVVIFGAMVIHYIFDIVDDIAVLGYVNSNWRRWGNGRKKKKR